MQGEDVDEATVQKVTQTYRQLVACLNAGDFLRVYALYTDDYLRRTLQTVELMSSPVPGHASARSTGNDGARRRERCSSARRWPVTARVETISSPDGVSTVIQAALEPVGDRLLIEDETVADVTAATPAAAAPPRPPVARNRLGAGAGCRPGHVGGHGQRHLLRAESAVHPGQYRCDGRIPNKGVTAAQLQHRRAGYQRRYRPGRYRGDGHQRPGRHLRVLLRRAWSPEPACLAP